MKLLPGYKRNEINLYVMIWKDTEGLSSKKRSRNRTLKVLPLTIFEVPPPPVLKHVKKKKNHSAFLVLQKCL